jgi:hypothetical protein
MEREINLLQPMLANLNRYTTSIQGGISYGKRNESY